ncbi:hypothetical protein EON63_00175 [archaeon]|nr:MAG: hypothetical protein EON63_00175 [archaeon]
MYHMPHTHTHTHALLMCHHLQPTIHHSLYHIFNMPLLIPFPAIFHSIPYQASAARSTMPSTSWSTRTTNCSSRPST